MDSLILDMHPFPSRTPLFQRITFAALGLINLAQGIVHYPGIVAFVNIGGGMLLLLAAIFYRRIHRPSVYAFGDEGIEGPVGTPKSRLIKWSDIAFFETKRFSFAIVTSSGDRIQLDLSNITYDQHKQIKPRIVELVKSKGVDVRAV
jgi:hypothetical protein